MTDEEKTCALCGLPITDDDYHDGEDGEMHHDECCPSCNGAEWKQQLDEARALVDDLIEVAYIAMNACNVLVSECRLHDELTAADIWQAKLIKAQAAIRLAESKQ